MKRIDLLQLRKIYAIGHALDISSGTHDDDLHALIEGVTGKISIRELSYREAAEVIKELSMRQGSYTPKKRRREEGTKIAGGITAGQKRKIWALMYEIEKITEETNASIGERLCGIIEKELRISAIPKDPFRFFDYRAGNRLIETLKGYVASFERKAVTMDGAVGPDRSKES